MDKPAIAGIKNILNKLSKEDLRGLTATVTQGLLKDKKQSREEAIEVILKYSPDVLSVLKRKVVTRDVLFSYLHDNQVVVELPTTKEKLITKLSELWHLTQTKEIRVHTESNRTSGSNGTVSTDQQTQQVGESNINSMAQQFTQWFYGMLNNNAYVDPDHFYPDAYLKLNLISNSTHNTEETETPPSIVELLYKTKMQHNLYFNPNMSREGVQGRLDPHGLVMVLTCGTLHSNNLCVGVFEQVFALARDPFCDNNWKIKNTELNLRSKNDNIGIPCLTDSELTSHLLALPSS